MRSICYFQFVDFGHVIGDLGAIQASNFGQIGRHSITYRGPTPMQLVAIVLLILPIVIWAQSPVEYDLSFNNAVHHEARISVTWRDIGNAPLQMRMSRSSPGRYAPLCAVGRR